MAKRLSEEAEGRFLEVLGRHEQIINKVIRIYGVDSENRRDLFQEIVYQLWRSFGSFKGESNISTWLYRVALNTAITSLRKSKKVPEHSELDDRLASSSGSIDASDRNEQAQQLYSAIRSLGEVDRAIVMLYLEELSYKDIAQVLGLTEDNVGVKLNRIKTKLRVLIGANQMMELNDLRRTWRESGFEPGISAYNKREVAMLLKERSADLKLIETITFDH